MPPIRLTLAALGAPLARRYRGLRAGLRTRRAWLAARAGAPDEASLPEPFLFGDSDRGRRLLAGIWAPFGAEILLEDGLIWQPALADPRLEVERHTFAWLDDLAALGTRSARGAGQAWTLEWIRRFGRGHPVAWRPDVAGRRMLRWTSHIRLLSTGLDARAARRLWRAVAAHGRVLARSWPEVERGLPQVEALSGAVLALALAGEDARLDPAVDALGRLAEALIDPSGAIGSRAPGELAEIVILLVWSARLLETVGRSATASHLHAIARAVPVLRATRLGDGAMARFHGGGPGRADRLDQALAELRLGAQPRPRLPMGYVRLAGGRLVAIMDGAPPPMGPGAPRGAAGTLAFELTSGRTPLVVNAGCGHVFGAEAALAARATAAHSTVEIDGAPSARLCRPGLAARVYGGWLEAGPSLVSVRQAQDHTGQWLLATHDGYVETHGLLHERRLFVDAKGTECRGEELVYVTDGRARDRFEAVARARPDGVRLVARFHLHPEVAVTLDPVRQSVEIVLPGGETWLFRAAGGEVELKDSVHFDPFAAAPRPALQIMVNTRVIEYLGQINWSFTRVSTAAAGAGPSPRRSTLPGP